MITAAEVRARYGDAGVRALTTRMRAEASRLRSLRDLDGPLGLLLELNPTWRSTPALRLISTEMERAITTPGSRLMISMPPQEGKSRLGRHAVVRALQHNPDCRIAIASYQERLARKSGEAARNIISTRGSGAIDPVTKVPLPDRLGIAVQAGSAAAGDWAVAGREGGVLSVGVGSGITGNAVDLLFVDDPLKGRQQADSEVIREALHDWWDNDAESRLGPHSSVIIIQTRWHEDDLIGRLLSDGSSADDEVEFGAVRDDVWRVVNIPALADGETLDSLADVPGGRTPEGWLVSARGDRSTKWARLAAKRPRVFASLYQGRPAPLEGGIFKQVWFDAHRLIEAPPLELVAVGVDPADTGKGDPAGILVGGRAKDGRIAFLADLSGQLSQAQWARRACLAAVRFGAARIVQERNLGMRTSVPDAWAIIYRQALALEAGRPNGHGDEDRVTQAMASLSGQGDVAAANEERLRELLPIRGKVLDRGPSAPRLVSVTAKVAKRVRAESVAGSFEDGRAVIVGRLPLLEHEATTWQEGQPSPNRLDTLAMLAGHLEQAKVEGRVQRPRGVVVPSSVAASPRR